MEVIHCFSFVLIFFTLMVGIAILAYCIKISIALVKMFDYMKSIGREEDDYEELEPKKQELPVGNYAVVNYDDE